MPVANGASANAQTRLRNELLLRFPGAVLSPMFSRVLRVGSKPFLKKNRIYILGQYMGTEATHKSRNKLLHIGYVPRTDIDCEASNGYTPYQIVMKGGPDTYVALFTGGSCKIDGTTFDVNGGLVAGWGFTTKGKYYGKATHQASRFTFKSLLTLLKSRATPQNGRPAEGFVGFKFVWKVLDNNNIDSLKGFIQKDKITGAQRKKGTSQNVSPNGALFKAAFRQTKIQIHCETNETPVRFMTLLSQRCSFEPKVERTHVIAPFARQKSDAKPETDVVMAEAKSEAKQETA